MLAPSLASLSTEDPDSYQGDELNEVKHLLSFRRTSFVDSLMINSSVCIHLENIPCFS